MKISQQTPLQFINDCDCIVDFTILEKAIYWYTSKPVYKIKHIYLHANYPTVSIYDEKVHIHRLIKSYLEQRRLLKQEYVHHKDGNKLNSNINNLEIIKSQEHQSLHNKNKILTKEHREKISLANHNRMGIKIKKRIEMPELPQLLKQKWSINKIAKFYNCDWSTVKNRIYENPELLEVIMSSKYSEKLNYYICRCNDIDWLVNAEPAYIELKSKSVPEEEKDSFIKKCQEELLEEINKNIEQIENFLWDLYNKEVNNE